MSEDETYERIAEDLDRKASEIWDPTAKFNAHAESLRNQMKIMASRIRCLNRRENPINKEIIAKEGITIVIIKQ